MSCHSKWLTTTSVARCRYLTSTAWTGSSSCFSLCRCASCCQTSSELWFSKRWCSLWCISRTLVYGFHTDINMDRMVSFCSNSWTSCFPLICFTRDFLNLIHISKILYLFLITRQDFPHGYISFIGIHLLLVGCYAMRLSRWCQDPLDLVIVHHDRVQGFLLLLSFILPSFHLSYLC